MSRFVTRPSARVFLAIPVFLALTLCAVEAWQDEPSNPALADEMAVVRRSMRSLRRSIGKPEENAKSIEAIVAMQGAMQKAKAMEPIKATTLEAADKAKFLTSYRVEMIGLQKQLLEMEQHLLRGDNAKAKKIYDGLKAVRDAAHKKYQ